MAPGHHTSAGESSAASLAAFQDLPTVYSKNRFSFFINPFEFEPPAARDQALDPFTRGGAVLVQPLERKGHKLFTPPVILQCCEPAGQVVKFQAPTSSDTARPD